MKKETSIPRKYSKNYYKFLVREAIIIGYIGSYDDVHSRLLNRSEGRDITHGQIFPSPCIKRWRWYFKEGIVDLGVLDTGLNKEESFLVAEHLYNKYDIPYWKNGYRDIDYLIKKCGIK